MFLLQANKIVSASLGDVIMKPRELIAVDSVNKHLFAKPI